MVSGGDVTPCRLNAEIGNSYSTMKIISSCPNHLDFELDIIIQMKKKNSVMATKGCHLVVSC
jgi:hypothetical protein